MFPSSRRRTPLISLVVLVLSLAGASCAPRFAPASGTIDIQLLAFNDFHGSLEPPVGSNGRVGDTPAGGVEYLATHLETLAATNAHTAIVSAGDNIGATPLISGMFHDEPTIEALSRAGLMLSAVGNHELDEGWDELYRMQNGGCHPVDGCQDKTPFTGASFRFLSANLLIDPTATDAQALQRSGWKQAGTVERSQTLFPPFAIREFNGVQVGFIGLTLKGVGTIVSPAGMKGITPLPEAAAANDAARALTAQGVRTIIVLIHEGGFQTGDPAQEDPNACNGFQGPIVDIANAMSADIDVIVSGHTHRAYVCTIGSKLVTSAASLSRLITDIDLTVDRSTGRVVKKTARNVVVTRDVTPSRDETALIEHYRPLAATVVMRPVGKTAGLIPAQRNQAGESALGDIIADGMLEAAREVAGRVDVAFMNSGGIRSDLVASGPSGTITFGDVFSVLPFGNVVIVKTMTGDAIARMLDEQFGPTSTRFLQVSKGFTYEWDPSKPLGSRVNRASIQIDGKPLVPTERYRVATLDFIWNGGDQFTVASEGSDPTAVGPDVDIFISHLGKHSPIAPGPQDRIRRVN